MMLAYEAVQGCPTVLQRGYSLYVQLKAELSYSPTMMAVVATLTS